MRFLIDTQAILWFQASDAKLSAQAKGLILDEGNACFISIVSLWEIAVKVNLNKLKIGMPFENLREYLITKNFEILNIEFTHLKTLLALDNYHKDPFDRLLIAQAITEGMTIISADRHFQDYPLSVIR